MTAGDAALIALPVSLAINGFFLRGVYAELGKFRDCLFGKDGVVPQLAVIKARHESEDRSAALGRLGRRAYDGHPGEE